MKEEVSKWLDQIESCMAEKVDLFVPENVVGKISELNPLLALSSNTVAIAEKLYNLKIGELVLAKEYRGLTATEKKMLFASLCADEQELWTRAERLNAGVTHVLDSLRSALSYLKQELVESKR